MSFMTLSRRHLSAQCKARNRNADYECKQKKKRVVEVATREGPTKRSSAPYGEARKNQRSSGGVTPVAAQRSPPQRQDGPKDEKGSVRRLLDQRTEGNQTHHDGCAENCTRLHPLLPHRRPRESRGPQQDNRCNDQRPGQIAHPPRHPY